MSESGRVEFFVQEISNVTDNNQDKVTSSLAVFANDFGQLT